MPEPVGTACRGALGSAAPSGLCLLESLAGPLEEAARRPVMRRPGWQPRGILEDARELASRRAAGQYFLQNGLAQKAARTGSREQAGARKAGPCGCIWPYSRALPGCFCRMAGRAAALTQQSRRLKPPLAAQSPRTAGNDNARGLWARVSPRGPGPGLPEYRQCVQCRWTGVPYWAGCRLRPVPPA